MRGVFSTCLYACFLYDWGNWFFLLPFSGGHFVEDSCSRLYSMLVWCTTEETGFSSCRLVEVTLLWIAVLASTACLFGVRLGKLVSSVATDEKFLPL